MTERDLAARKSNYQFDLRSVLALLTAACVAFASFQWGGTTALAIAAIVLGLASCMLSTVARERWQTPLLAMGVFFLALTVICGLAIAP